MFGLLNEAEKQDSLDPKHYARRRGRFYLVWNASKISGRPMLVALLAGNAAHEAEITNTSVLLADINERFRKMFSSNAIPTPREVIVTRWKRDPFTRGTYSYVGPRTRPGDYDLMAQSVGNLHFAGEATCGTHPATVHGAFLSGLRVAAEVMDAMVGPISLPTPLVGASPVKSEVPARYSVSTAPPSKQRSSLAGLKTAIGAADKATTPMVKQEPGTTQSEDTTPLWAEPSLNKLSGPPRHSVCSSDPAFWAQPSLDGSDLDYEARVVASILSQIGDRPVKPTRPGVNPFLLFTKVKWDECKQSDEHNKNPAGQNAIRATLGKWWRALSEEEKEPYLLQSQKAQEAADEIGRQWKAKVEQWDVDARRIRLEYMRDHPAPVATNGKPSPGSALEGLGVSKRKTNVSNCVVLDHV